MSRELTDVLHDRALMALRSHLRAERYHASMGHFEAGDPVTHAGYEGRLLAMEWVGAISAEEVASWRQRLHEAASWREPPREPPARAVRERAIAHLEERIAPLSPSMRDGFVACIGAIVAYEQTGVLMAEEALAWRERLRARIDMEPERPPRCSRRDLVRVLPGPPERIRGLRVTTVELYADGVVVRWHDAQRRPDASGTPRIWSDTDRQTAGHGDPYLGGLSDDLGTRYIGGGGPDLGINGGWKVRFGSSSFTPAFPNGARRLTVAYEGSDFEIEL